MGLYARWGMNIAVNLRRVVEDGEWLIGEVCDSMESCQDEHRS